MSIGSFAWAVLGSSATTILLLGALGWLLRTWIGERFKASVKHEYEERLETLKADLNAQLAVAKAAMDAQAERLKAASHSFAEVQKATIIKKIEAVDGIWAATRHGKAQVPGVVYLCDALNDDELKRLRTDNKFAPLVTLLTKINPVDLTQKIFGEAEDFRLHVGEYVWGLFATYHTIIVRMLFILNDPKSDPRWYRDSNIGGLVVSAFGQEKFKALIELPYRRFEWLRRAFEAALLSAFDEVLSGKEFSEAALRQAQNMERAISDASSAAITEAPRS